MIPFHIVPDHGDPYDMTAGTRDVLVWEKTGKKVFSQLMENIAMTDMYRVAWIAARRLGHFEGTLAEFETSVEVEFDVDEVESPDPTRPDRSPATSSPSPSTPASRPPSGRKKANGPS